MGELGRAKRFPERPEVVTCQLSPGTPIPLEVKTAVLYEPVRETHSKLLGGVVTIASTCCLIVM
jgi:hypothetical protein